MNQEDPLEDEEDEEASQRNPKMWAFALFLLWNLSYALQRESEVEYPKFVPENVPIPDYANGDLSPLLENSLDTLLLLYAPWDVESKRALDVLIRLRQMFQATDLELASVNCWVSSGNCFQRFFSDKLPSFNRFASYPLWVYVPKNKGRLDPLKNSRVYGGHSATSFPLILSFLLRNRSPLKVWSNREEWIRERARYGGLAVVAHFESIGEVKEYLRGAETLATIDSTDEIIPIGLAFNSTLAKSLNCYRSVRLFWLSGSASFPKSVEFNRTNLVEWIKQTFSKKEFKMLVPNFKPAVVKNTYLNSMLEAGSGISFLSFFNPSMSLYDKGLSLTREIALLYHTSKRDFDINRGGVRELYDALVEQRLSADGLLFKNEFECKRKFKFEFSGINTCPDSLHYNGSVSFKVHKQVDRYFGDEKAIEEVIEEADRFKCVRFAYDEADMGCVRSYMEDFIGVLDENIKNELLNISPSNETLNFYGLNLIDNEHIAKSLGLNPLKSDVIIEDINQENRWRLQNAFTARNFGEFVLNFHYRRNLMHPYFKTKENLEACSARDLCITEISAANFKSVVLDSSKSHVIVLHQTLSCYFCAAARKAVHEAQLYFQSVDFEHPQRIRFVTIDSRDNDLPWEHTAPLYPSLVLYPAEDKSRSPVYPLGETYYGEDVIQFILQNLNPEDALRVEAHWCKEECLKTILEQLRNAIASNSDVFEREFPEEFVEMRRLYAQTNDILYNGRDHLKYDFLRAFKNLKAAIGER